VTTRDGVVVEDQTDPVLDIAAVLGDVPRMLTQEVLQRLAERNPGRYRKWTFADLKRVLKAAGAEPYKSDGHMVVSRDKVLKYVAESEENRLKGGAEER
jgi:S-DNA-T family DNA segregation ATPase FtsK/SpoIIIE